MAFGFAYCGGLQWFIYVTCFSRVSPHAIRFANLPWREKIRDKAGQIDLLKQTILDNFLHFTFIYFPCFYTMKELIQCRKPGDSVPDSVSSALDKYRNNFWTDNFAMW